MSQAVIKKTSDYFKFSYKTAKKGFFGITKEAIQSTLKFSKPKNTVKWVISTGLKVLAAPLVAQAK